MAIQLQLRRGTTTENNTFVGAEGEVTVDVTTDMLRLHDGNKLGGFVIPSVQYVQELLNAIIPVGLIAPYGGTTAPSGWLMCNGQAVSRTTYSLLFNKIGTAFGAGDGSTTFNLPNTNWRSIEGITGAQYLGNKSDGSLPNITADFYMTGDGWYPSGAVQLSGSKKTAKQLYTIRGDFPRAYFNASWSKTAYSRNDNEVHPRSIALFYIIKY